MLNSQQGRLLKSKHYEKIHRIISRYHGGENSLNVFDLDLVMISLNTNLHWISVFIFNPGTVANGIHEMSG